MNSFWESLPTMTFTQMLQRLTDSGAEPRPADQRPDATPRRDDAIARKNHEQNQLLSHVAVDRCHRPHHPGGLRHLAGGSVRLSVAVVAA